MSAAAPKRDGGARVRRWLAMRHRARLRGRRDERRDPGRGRRGGKKCSVINTAISILGGAALGYLYHRVVGCRSGACPITASPTISTLYGAAMGLLTSLS